MTEMLKPQSGESIYDPTCGSAGMLISAIAYLKEKGQEWRNVKVYGQEINALTSAIGKMNLFLHGVKDFNIVNDDTLTRPAFTENGKLKQFDLVLANPPYSISQWDREAFESDKYGRNSFGVPPQSRADYAFIQHIISSLNLSTGRAAILLPHGVLNRNEEKDIRRRIIQTDCIEAVIGLGRHLFYNSGLESCILVIRMNKPKGRRNKILFIDAENCIHKEQAQCYLFPEDIQAINSAYKSDADIKDFSRFVDIEDVIGNDANLNIKLYVNNSKKDEQHDAVSSFNAFLENYGELYDALKNVTPEIGFAKIFDNVSFGGFGFDKSKWSKVKLSDVAEEYSERVDHPATSEYEWYIGSDNIAGFDFRITSKTAIEKINSSQKAFKKGDYLLVRRSLYGSDFRERAPRADFDGVCSADILTIREKPEFVADGYLIAVLYSSELWRFIVSNSTGSLTRRIKWKQLADFEFLIPPLEEQKYIADLLWSIYETKYSYENLLKETDDFVKARFVELFGSIKSNDKGWNSAKLKDIADVRGRVGWKGYKKEDLRGSGPLVLGATHLTDNGDLDLSAPVYLSREKYEESPEIVLQKNDLIFTQRGNTIGKVGLVAEDIGEATINPCVLILRPLDINPVYFKTYFVMDETKEDMWTLNTGSAQPMITQKGIGEYQLRVPPLELQNQFADFVNQVDKSKFEIKKAIINLDSTIHGLLQLME